MKIRTEEEIKNQVKFIKTMKKKYKHMSIIKMESKSIKQEHFK